MSKCPECGSTKFDYSHYSEFGIGTVEQHGLCPQCGYIVEQAYSRPIDGFDIPSKKGYRSKVTGRFYPKNIRKRKRIRRKANIKINDPFAKRYVLTFMI